VVEVEHSTEALAPMHWLRWCDHRGGPQELICEAPMIAFSVVVRHEVGDRVLKRGVSEEDHSVQALGLCGAHEAFGERIQIRRSRRESNEVDALADEGITKLV